VSQWESVAGSYFRITWTVSLTERVDTGGGSSNDEAIDVGVNAEHRLVIMCSALRWFRGRNPSPGPTCDPAVPMPHHSPRWYSPTLGYRLLSLGNLDDHEAIYDGLASEGASDGYSTFRLSVVRYRADTRHVGIVEPLTNRNSHIITAYSGNIATVDSKGRIALRKDVRERLGINPGTEVDVREDDGKMIVEPEDDPPQIIDRMEKLVGETSSRRRETTPIDDTDGPIAR